MFGSRIYQHTKYQRQSSGGNGYLKKTVFDRKEMCLILIAKKITENLQLKMYSFWIFGPNLGLVLDSNHVEMFILNKHNDCCQRYE